MCLVESFLVDNITQISLYICRERKHTEGTDVVVAEQSSSSVNPRELCFLSHRQSRLFFLGVFRSEVTGTIVVTNSTHFRSCGFSCKRGLRLF